MPISPQYAAHLDRRESGASDQYRHRALSVYRIVQESLTNVLKHAGPATARVSVQVTPDAVTVDVVDDGNGDPGPVDPHLDRGGHGLVGMRERVALFGGELRATPRSGGGFEVHARLPRVAHRA